MNVLLINGSPHAHGCTDAALQEIAKALNADGIETTIYHIGAVPVGGCVGCGGCAKAGHCVFGGPVVDVLPLVEKADGIVFGAPVHYSTAAASMLGFMHRLGYSAGRLLAQKARRYCYQRPPRRHHQRTGSPGKGSPVLPDAADQLHLLADGTRQQRRTGRPGRRGHADHAQPGPQHGLDLEVHCRRQSRRD